MQVSGVATPQFQATTAHNAPVVSVSWVSVVLLGVCVSARRCNLPELFFVHHCGVVRKLVLNHTRRVCPSNQTTSEHNDGALWRPHIR